MTSPAADFPDRPPSPLPGKPVIYRGGGNLFCPHCGREADEFAHLADGPVFARHTDGSRIWVCQVQ